MKKWLFLNVILAATLILGACSTSNNVVSNKLISKRKYEKGFHINSKSNLKTQNDELAEEKLVDEKREDKIIREDKIKKSGTVNINNNNVVSVIDDVDVRRGKSIENVSSFDSNTGDSFESNEEVSHFTAEKLEGHNEISIHDKMNTIKREARGSGNSDLVNILIIVLIVILIILLLSILSDLLGPFSWIISLVLAVILIYFILKVFGII